MTFRKDMFFRRKLGMRRLRAGMPCVVLLISTGTIGSAATDTLKLVNAGSGYVMGGVYTSPYGVAIDGSPTPTLLICDDFETNVSIGQTWTAIPTTLADLQAGTNPGTPKFTDNEIYNS